MSLPYKYRREAGRSISHLLTPESVTTKENAKCRLFMRPVRESDALTLYHLHTDPLVLRLTSDGIAMSERQSKEGLDLDQEFHFGLFFIYGKQIMAISHL